MLAMFVPATPTRRSLYTLLCIGPLFALAACDAKPIAARAPSSTDTGVPFMGSVVQPAPVAVPVWLSDNDQAGIKAEVRSRLLSRPINPFSERKSPCSEVFGLGEPTIVDSTLGDQTGKIKIAVPIAVVHPMGDGPVYHAPDKACYGYENPGWTIGEPVNVTFEFEIERWQTGWKVSQRQTSGF